VVLVGQADCLVGEPGRERGAAQHGPPRGLAAVTLGGQYLRA